MSNIKLLPTARETLLQLMTDWFMTTGHGSREAADAILSQHRAEIIAELQAGPWGPTVDLDTVDAITDFIAGKGVAR